MNKKEKTYSVYMHCCPNGSIYVGRTSITPSRRWNGGKGYQNNQKFSGIINEVGWRNIKHITVASGLQKETATSMERFLITLTKETHSLNVDDKLFTWDENFTKTDAMNLFADGKVSKFYNSALNDEVYQWLVFGRNNTAFTSTATDLAVFENETNQPKKVTNMKKRKVKAKALRRKRLNGVNIEVVLDTRYEHNNGTFPVCIRVYHNRKYKWLSTGFTMDVDEFYNMSVEDDAVIGKMFEAQCKKVVDCALSGTTYDLDMATRAKNESTVGVQCLSLSDLIIEKSTMTPSKGTMQNYKNTANLVSELCKNGLPLQNVSTESVKDLYNKLIKRGYKPATINIQLSIIRASINYGIYKGYLNPEQYPFKRQAMEVDKITLPKSDKRDENYLTKSEMQTVWGKFKETKNKKLGWFLFSYLHGGMNIADMMGLKFTNFYFDEGGFIFQRMKTKGRNDFKTYIPATTWTSELFDIMGITPANGEYVFKDMQHTKGEYTQIKNILSTLVNRELEKLDMFGKKVTFTTARHSFATNATKEGMHFTMVEQAMSHALNGVSSHYIGRWDVGEMRQDFEKLL